MITPTLAGDPCEERMPYKLYGIIDHVGNCIIESTSYFSFKKLIHLQRYYPPVLVIPYPAKVGV